MENFNYTDIDQHHNSEYPSPTQTLNTVLLREGVCFCMLLNRLQSMWAVAFLAFKASQEMSQL